MKYFRSRRKILLSLCILSAPLSQQANASAALLQSSNQGFTLAFVDADSHRVIDAVLGSMLEYNYSIDADVTGNLTLRTTRPVSARQLLPLLERALAGINAVIIRNGNDYRVVLRKNARAASAVGASTSRNQSPPVNGERSSPGFSSENITLQFASAEEIVKVAADLIGEDIISIGRAGFNEVLVSGTGEERDAAKRLISRFDVDSLANMNFEIWKLEDVDADTLVDELDRIFAPPYDLGSRVRLVPLPRLNSVLAIASSRSDIARIEPWIRRLDNGGSGKRKLYSYAVQNGRAGDIATALQAVLGGSDNGQNDAANAPLASLTDGGVTDNQNIQAAPQNNAQTNNVVGNGSGLKIVPNTQNNSLLIYANGEEYSFIRDALDKIDRPVVQVLIEATLAEVTLSDELRYGINFQSSNAIGSTNTTFTNSSTSGPVPASSFPGFSVSVIGNTTSGVLNTLQSKTNVKVLSAPKIMTLNNEPATLQVGDQVPVVTQQAQSVDAAGAPIVNNIELRDTGVILQVTPRVNDSGTIILDISQEVSDVATTTSSGINSPTIQQRRLTSTVATKSGQMVALGGLIRERQVRTKSGIPVLSQIPIIGGLFGQKVNTGSRTELIILITPTVIRSPDEVKNTVDALIDGLDLTRPLVDTALESEIGPSLPSSTTNNNATDQ